MGKRCLVQLNDKGDAIRIIKTAKLARLLPVEEVAEWDKAHAVRSVRWLIYERSKNDDGNPECEWCGRNITWDTGHMHERVPRGSRDDDGNAGEISVDNSVFLCWDCHLNVAHANRRWHRAKLKEQ
jgi:hypothetical protein